MELYREIVGQSHRGLMPFSGQWVVIIGVAFLFQKYLCVTAIDPGEGPRGGGYQNKSQSEGEYDTAASIKSVL